MDKLLLPEKVGVVEALQGEEICKLFRPDSNVASGSQDQVVEMSEQARVASHPGVEIWLKFSASISRPTFEIHHFVSN